jgi:hypothetical protein
MGQATYSRYTDTAGRMKRKFVRWERLMNRRIDTLTPVGEVGGGVQSRVWLKYQTPLRMTLAGKGQGLAIA